jgi:Flp pilus assembly protein TadD
VSEPRLLRLHGELYAASAITSAIDTYAKHATITRTDEAPYVSLAIASDRPGRADKVARELANYALGLTIQSQKSATGPR